MDEDVLELTQMVQDDGSVVDVDDPQDDDPWSRAMDPEPEPEPDDPEPPLSLETLDDLFDKPAPGRSPSTGMTTTISCRRRQRLLPAPLSRSLPPALAATASPEACTYGGGPTVEDILKDLAASAARGLARSDLPPMVERMVQREIEKMVRRAQGG